MARYISLALTSELNRLVSQPKVSLVEFILKTLILGLELFADCLLVISVSSHIRSCIGDSKLALA